MDTNYEQQSSIALAILTLAQEVRALREELQKMRERHDANVEIEERLAEARARSAGSLYSLR